MRASVASAARSLEVQMFMGGMGAAPKRAGAPKKAKVASSAFAKNAKRPKASLNILERGPAGIAEPLKEGKKFFSEENWLYQAFDLLRDLPAK